MPERIVFFRGTPESAPPAPPLPSGYEGQVWRPSATRIRPPGCGLFPFVIWWLMYVLGLFGDQEYCVFLIHRNGRPVHRTVITPRFFRFPFMAAGDLQAGNLNTAADERGKGLATTALLSLLAADPNRKRSYWYLAEEDNRASIHVAEHANFIKVGRGNRTSRFGLRLFGSYQIGESCHG